MWFTICLKKLLSWLMVTQALSLWLQCEEPWKEIQPTFQVTIAFLLISYSLCIEHVLDS
jgi:hypothetical protein